MIKNREKEVMHGQLFLGIDGGGSKCKALLADGAGRVLGEGVAGPANAFQDRDLARRSMLESARGALAAAQMPDVPLDGVVVGAGLAGVNIPRVAGEMEAWEHPFARFYLATDIHIACLAAHGGEQGAVIVAGTGSVGYSTRGGASYGAHGFPCGDKGSGAWLGLEAIKAALLASDGLGPETLLLTRVEALLGESGAGIVDAMAGASSRDYGTLAPLVLECAEEGDPVARSIVAEGAAYLSDMAARLLGDSDDALCLLGGLGEKLRPWMRPELAARVIPPVGQPDEGALRFALECFRRES